jgi:excisionase family DNA binding protein
MSNNDNARALTPIAFSVADAAGYVGISRSSLYELKKRGLISFVKIGRRTLIPRADLDRLIGLSGGEDASHGRSS